MRVGTVTGEHTHTEHSRGPLMRYLVPPEPTMRWEPLTVTAGSPDVVFHLRGDVASKITSFMDRIESN